MIAPIDVVQPPVPQPVHAIIDRLPKPEDIPWHHSPDVWVAIWTGVLAIATIVLAIYTYRLFDAAQKARADSKEAHKDSVDALAVARDTLAVSQKALGISESNAAAAQEGVKISQEQMERSLRPYVIVDEIAIKKNLDNFFPIDVTIFIINSGQLPATDTVIECFAGIQILVTSASPGGYEQDDGMKQLKGVIGHNQRRELVFGFTESFVRKHRDALNFGGRQLFLRGAIDYVDVVTNQKRKTEFSYVWHSQRGYFTPDDAMGNTIT